MNKIEAIYQLNPTVVTIRGDVAYDADENEVAYDNAAVEALVASKAYIDNRLAEYPSIGDQLDALFHAGVFPAEMAATIQAVKDRYPKGDA
jgi:hypothetical protein